MNTAKTSQLFTEQKIWSNHNNGDKTYSKRWPPVSDDVSLQIQCLCALFIKDRLKRDGLLNKKFSIHIDVLPNAALRHIIVIINRMSTELERLHPRTFCNVSIPLPEAAPVIIESIGRTLFKHNDITWGKIISFMTISSAIAVDCAKSGQSEVIQSVVDSTFSVMNEEAGQWIELEGGWNALTEHIRPMGSEHITFLGCLTLMIGFLVTIHISWTSFKFLGKQILNIL